MTPRIIGCIAFGVSVMFSSMAVLAAWSIDYPLDGTKYRANVNIQPGGIGPSGNQGYSVFLKDPSDAVVVSDTGSTTSSSPYTWNEMFIHPYGGWDPIAAGWTISLVANGAEQEHIHIEIVPVP